jgi:hypothetical protein
MKIFKHIESKIYKDYFFIKGNIDLDQNYFIDKIKKGVEQENNLNNKTNVQGRMTDWRYFNDDLKFYEILLQLVDYVDDKIYTGRFAVNEAWGFEEGFGQKTTKHSHSGSLLSGVIYLSKVNQPLKFNQIGEEVNPDIGNFALFSGWLEHGCPRNYGKDIKYGISFNTTKNYGI